VSTDKNDISQIGKYLKGKLDTRAMHQLEREAQDDPFLMESLEGYEAVGNDQQANLTELHNRLTERITPKKERNLIIWRILPIAASLLLMLGIGYWYFTPKQAIKQVAAVIKPKTVKQPATTKPAIAQIAVTSKLIPVKRAGKKTVKQPAIILATQKDSLLASANTNPGIVYKTDTVEYRASAYKVKANETVNDLLKNMEGFQVGADGSVTHQGQAVTKVRLNGKDYAGGDVKQATKNLPPDIIEKIQVVDDYGDQANKTGIKSGDSNKTLNFNVDTSVFYKKRAQMNAARDTGNIITKFYQNVKAIPYKTDYSFDYKYTFDQINKIIKVVSSKKIGGDSLHYIIDLKDTKGIFNNSHFSVGDDYQYISSYFMIGDLKLPLNKVHGLNSENNLLTQISNVWSDRSDAMVKSYRIADRKIYLIKGINPFCNGRNCTDYVVYILQVENGKGSIQAIYFNGINRLYDFNNTNLFYDQSSSTNPKIFIPKTGKLVNSIDAFDIYDVRFNKLIKVKGLK